MPIARPRPVGPEASPWYWNPGCVYAIPGPVHFTKRLHEIGDDLAITWTPIQERWLVWNRTHRINQKICRGWNLLFIVATEENEYCPLDERVLAKVYDRSSRKWGGAKDYFNRVVSEIERDKEKTDKARSEGLGDAAGDYWDHTKIMTGYGNRNDGSKFVKHHAGG
jgi:hypothetical protein